ncbi:hypothetical protein BDV98DRAFT_594280 [Pterulicium gracile]|uniref:Uncharacterized protein n=1 Tax=Pterulicium gracile TaxID=1884261 RepID=A0A5C3QDF0_9AGAR|nr:hypothetical protein BDV98DRAFT_594280 [Pterula gracilis]
MPPRPKTTSSYLRQRLRTFSPRLLWTYIGPHRASFAGHAYHLDVASMTIFIVWMIAGCGPAYHSATDNSPYNSQERDGHTPSPKCGKLKVPVQVSVGGSAAPSWEYNTKEQDVRKCPSALDESSQKGRSRTSSNVTFHPIINADIVDADSVLMPFDDIPRAGEEELPFVYIIGCNVGFSWLARIFTMAVMLSNWLLIVLLVYITVVVYAAGEETSVGDGILAIPLTIVVSIPALRELFIGAPPFGTQFVSSPKW